MGIFRAGVRVNRALTPTPSSSSSDHEDFRAKKKFRTAGAVVDVRDYEDGSEISQVGDSICGLPYELFMLPDLGDVLSIQTWNECLTEEERQSLSAYLPDVDKESCMRTLKEVLGGECLNFGTPLHDLWQSLKGGACHPSVVKNRQTLLFLQRREHYHNLREYQNGMVKALLEMRDVWSTHPEVEFEEKLRTWQAWKSKLACSETDRKMVESQLTEKVKLKAASNAGEIGDKGQFSGFSQQPHTGFSSKRHVIWDAGYKMQLEGRENSQRLDGDPSYLRVSFGRSGRNGEIIGMQTFPKQSTSESDIGVKRKYDYIQAGHAITAGESEVNVGHVQMKAKFTTNSKAQNAQRKMEEKKRHDRHGKGRGADAKASVYEEHASTRVSVEICGHTEMGFSAAEVVYEANIKDSTALTSSHGSSLFNPAKPFRKADTMHIPSSVLGFPFSPLHLFSAVRAVMVDPPFMHESSGINSEVMAIPFREIVRSVQARPGDPRVLEVALPLDGLIRGVLKTLCCTSKKPGSGSLKPFVAYDKAIRCWLWIGPVQHGAPSFDEVDVQALPEVWNTCPSVLLEFQDAFAKWLKNAERTLQQLGQLALLPLPLFPVLPDARERFKDLRAQKSLNTIFPSSYEVRALFRKEECVRYSALEIAFCYTTADGRKAAVAPLRRIGGKSKAKARDHFMLKPDRPSHITILCLVRDAAARLPQGIGTRADVCTLLRDSQFIMEDVAEAQLSQVVSGALDRLHYERDPCVRYDSDKKLWLYLHGDRDEEDFDEGGTTSTRSSRRCKKDGANVGGSPIQGNGDNEDLLSEPEPELGSFNDVDVGGLRESDSPELLYDHHHRGPATALVGGQSAREEVLLPLIDLPASMQAPFCGNMQSHPMGWEVFTAGKEISMRQQCS